MTRLRVEDEEIGRGRQNDSSSSRESSPRRPQKRSFSPTSDDGNLVVPPIADDDTPPPLERPLLRQPVGFAWNNSSSLSTAPPGLNTYQASTPITAPSSSPVFLPGQEVPFVLPAPKSKSSRPKRSDGTSSKKRRTAEYSGQTGRFRLSKYDPTPSASPPIHHGQGPYSSMYRAPSDVTGRGFNTASPTPTLSSSGGTRVDSVFSPPSALDALTTGSAMSQSTAKRHKQVETRTKPPAGRPKAKAKPSGKGKASASSRKASTSVPSNNVFASHHALSASRDATSGGHYRHDYADRAPQVLDNHSPSRSPGHSPLPEPRASNFTAVSSPVGGSATDAMDMGVRRVVRQLRMVTLLIQDLRSGTADHQLAEVKIPLKAADDPQDGFWADAKELSEKLQASPARIDGPARAYTLRGKYRQFFLRVTAENVDEYISANLVVRPDRTLDVVVETLPVPGAPPLPPQIPRDLRSPSPESYPTSPIPTQREIFLRPDYGSLRNLDENHLDRSSSASLSDRDTSPHSISRTSYGSREMRASSNNTTITQAGSSKRNRGYGSPASDEESDELHETISKAMDDIMRKDYGWTAFFKAKAGKRVSDVLSQYRFVQRMMNEWVGKRAPFRTCNYNVEARHITRALEIKDPKYSSDCTETLDLLALYGPQGQRYADPRIIAMVNDTSLPEYNAKPIKRMLHLLQEIDKKWKKDHPPGAGSPASASSHGTGEN